MSRILTRVTRAVTAGTTTTGAWPVDADGNPAYDDGDLLIAVFAVVGNVTFASGDTSAGAAKQGHTMTMQGFRRYASGAEAPPSATHASATFRFCLTWVIKGAVASDPIDTGAYATAQNSSPSNSCPFSNGTTNFDRVAALHIGLHSAWNHMQLEPGPTPIVSTSVSGSAGTDAGLAAAVTWHETSGDTTGGFEWWLVRQVRNAISICIPVKMDTGVYLARADESSPCAEILLPGADQAANNCPFEWTRTNPTTDLPDILGVSTAYTSFADALGIGVNVDNVLEKIGAAAVGVDEYDAMQYTLSVSPGTFPYDLTGKKIAFHPMIADNAFRFDELSNHGLVVGMASYDGTSTSTFAYEIFDAGGVDQRSNEIRSVVIDAADATPIDTEGSFDISAVRAFLIAGRNISGNAATVAGDTIAALSPLVLTGGDSVHPVSWSTAYEHVTRLGLLTIEKQGNAYRTKHPITIGNGGTTRTEFSTNGDILQAPVQNFEFQSDNLPIVLNLGGSDVCDWVDPIEGGGTMEVTIDGSPSVAWNFAGGSLNNPKSITMNDIGAGNYDGFTISNSAVEVVREVGADYAGVSFSGFTSAQALTISGTSQAELQAELDLLARAVFSANVNHGLRIRFHTGTGNIELNTPASMSIDKLLYDAEASGSKLTLVRANGSTIDETAVADDETIEVKTPITITINALTGRTYRVYNVTADELVDEGSGVDDVAIPFTLAGQELSILVGADQSTRWPSTITTGSADIPVFPAPAADPFRSVDDATALAYSGIAIDYGAETVTVTATRTLTQIYEFLMATSNTLAGLAQVQIVSSADGSQYLMASGWDLIIGASGVVIEAGKEWTVQGGGQVLTQSGGVFEDANGLQYESGGSVYYASHFYAKVRDDASNDPIEGAVVAFIDDDNGVDRTLNASRSAGALVTDANGDAEGYAIWKIDSTAFSGHKRYVGKYAFLWSTVPLPIDGAPLGASGSPVGVRLNADTRVTLTEAQALALTDATVTHASSTVDLNGLTYSEANDNLKARQASVSEIEAGKKGFMSYYEEGWLVSFDGSFYNGKSGWTYQNNAGTGVWQGGTVDLGTPGNIDLDFKDTTIKYTAAGTYDHRGETMDGTITFTDSAGGAVLVQVDTDVTYVDSGANVTVDASSSFDFLAANIIDDSRCRIYNKTQGQQLHNAIVSGGSGVSVALTYGAGQEVEPGDELEFTAIHGFGSTHYFPIVATRTANGADIAITDEQKLDTEANAVMAATGWTGESLDKTLNPTTGEILADFANVQIDVNDPDGDFDVRKGVIWFNYIVGTETGIQIYNPFALERKPDIRNIDIDGPLLVDNQGVTLNAFGGVWKRKDGNPIIAAGSNTIHWVPDDRVYNGPVQESGVSGLTSEESNVVLTDIPALTALAAEIQKILKNQNVTDPTDSKQKILDDDNSTVLLEAPVFEDAAGTTPWTGDAPILRRDKLEAP